MRKILLSAVALASFSFANAQMKTKGNVEITPKVGISSFAEFSENGNTGYNSGIEFGATLDYYFNNRWSFRSGIVADKMGSKSKEAGTTYEDELNYISIPLNANWHFGKTRNWNLNFGFSPSFLTSATFIENGTSMTIPDTAIESFQLGLTYGIGYKIPVNEKFGILIDAQFFNGLSNINKTSQETIQNSGYSFNVGGVIQL